MLDRNQKAREHRTVIEKLDGIDAKVSSSQDYDAYAELLEKHKALMAKYNELVEKFNSQVEVVRYLNNRVKELEKSR